MSKKAKKESLDQQALLCFSGYLRTLLPHRYAKGEVLYRFNQSPSIKDAIEACGIPHTEVNLILVNGQVFGFDYLLHGADHVRIIPPNYPCEISSGYFLAEESLPDARFILDVHLGKLARKLRLLGFDCLYRNDYEDPEIVAIAIQQKRTVLTRDRGILKHAIIHSGMLIRSSDHVTQTAHLLNRYKLWGQIRLQSRCVSCNGMLEIRDKQAVAGLLKPMTLKCCDDFWQCRDCGKLYWSGAHSDHISEWLRKVRKLASENDISRGQV